MQWHNCHGDLLIEDKVLFRETFYKQQNHVAFAAAAESWLVENRAKWLFG